MTYRRIRKAKFFADEITARINRGHAITSWTLGEGSFASGSDQYDLIDLDPYNTATYDTSGNTTTHVINSWNGGGLASNSGYDFCAVMNHNLPTVGGVILVKSGSSAIDDPGEGNVMAGITAVRNGTVNPATGETLAGALNDFATSFDITDGSAVTVGEIIGIDDEAMRVTNVAGATITVSGRGIQGTSAAAHDPGASVYRYGAVKPSADGDTVITFTQENEDSYYGVMFLPEGAFDGVTDLQVGAILLGRTYTTPVSPDMSISTGYNYGGVSVRETVAGKRHAYASWLTGNVNDGSAIYQPFARGTGLRQYGGRFYADLTYSYMADTDIFPSDMSAPGIPNTNILSDVVLRSIDGAHRPFITLLDSTSTTEGDFIWGRLVNNSLQLNQVSTNTYTASFRIEQEI